MKSGGKDVHPVAGHAMNGSHNKETWTVYKQMNRIQCRRLAELYEMIGNLNYLCMDNGGSEGGRKRKSN